MTGQQADELSQRRASGTRRGSHVVFDLTSTGTNDPGFVQWDNVDLSLPGLTGTLAASGDFASTLVAATLTVTGAPCPAPVPIP